MTTFKKLIGAASVPALVAALAIPAAAQTGTPPSTMTVPNSSNQVQCNSNGTATVTSGTNAQTSTANTVPGTQVTQNNPSGQGTTTTQTPTMQKPASSTTAQCPKQTPPATTMPQQNAAPVAPMTNGTMGNGPNGENMNALTNNPNGSQWLSKFDRPVQPPSYAGTKTHRKHRAKRASGGGGH